MEIKVTYRDKEFTSMSVEKRYVTLPPEEFDFHKDLVIYRESGGPVIFDSVGDNTSGWREYLTAYITRNREYHVVKDDELTKFLGDFKIGGYQSF